VCEICDARLEPDDHGAPAGGLVTFQPDDRSREWHRRAAETPGFVGHPPDTGWFCSTHIDAAREAARTLSHSDGLQHLRAATTRTIDLQTLAFPDPDGPMTTSVVPIRSADGIRRVLHDHHEVLATAIGTTPDRISLRVSTGWRLDDRHDRSVAHSIVDDNGASAVHLFDRVEYERIDGELVARLIETRVMRDSTLLALVSVGPFDRLQTWAGDERLRAWSDAIGAALGAPPPDLTDPAPDLIGVDLGSARLMASDGFGLRWVEWQLDPIDVDTLAASMRDAVPTLFAALSLGTGLALDTRTDRTWNPMDGAEPPYCPFTDTTVNTGRSADGTVATLRMVLEHWNDTDVSSATLSLSIGDLVSISAYGPTGGGRTITTVRLYRPTTPAVVDLVAELVT
jgi:hypothetical protein